MISFRPVVCQLVHSLNVGGAEILASNLARRLESRYRFIFICLDELGSGAERLRDAGFEVETIGRKAGLDWRCPLRLAAIWRERGVELVQAHQYTPFFYAMMARLRHRRPAVIFTEHGRHFPDFPRRKRKIANRLLIEKRDRVVAVGRTVKDALTENEGIPSCRIDVIVNGIDTEKYAFSQSIRSSVRAELNVSGDQYLVMMVARLDPVKDHLTAMRACARAATVTPGLRLVLVGDGPQRGSIEKYILDNRLGDIVRILGTRPDVQRLLTAADTLLLTSVSEGIPLTIIEGMATGLPVISTNVGSVADVVMEGVTGLLAKPGDDESLAKHLTTLGRSPSLRSTMGVRGRERAISEFSETKMAESYAAVFEAALRSDSVRLLRSAKC